MGAWTRMVTRGRWWFVGVAVLVLIVGATYGVGVLQILKAGGQSDPSSGSYQEDAEAQRAFPDAQISLILLLRDRVRTVDNPGFQDDARQIIRTVKAFPATQSVASYFDKKSATFVSRDRHEMLVTIRLKGSDDAQKREYLQLLPLLNPKGPLEPLLGGPIVASYEIDNQVKADLPTVELLSFPILLIALLLIFRSAVAALLPLLIGGISILGAFTLLHIASYSLQISEFASNLISLLGMGLAIDYSLLLVSRFRDELHTKSVAEALETTLRTAGESIFFSGCMVTLSLMGMLVFPSSFLRSMGLGGAMGTFCAMLASLTILPAILAILGERVNKGALTRKQPELSPSDTHRGFWFHFSHLVMRQAVLVIVATLALLLFLGVPFLHTRFAQPDADSLPPEFATRLSADRVQQDFAVGQAPPIQVLVFLQRPATSPEMIFLINDYVQRLRALPGVTTIDSLVTIDKRIPAPYGYMYFYGKHKPGSAEAAKHFANGQETILLVHYAGTSDSAQAQALVAAIRSTIPPIYCSALVGGDTAELVDRLDTLYSNIPLAVGLIVLTTCVLLSILLRSVVVPLKAVILNTLSLSASFGLMTWIFQEGHLERLLRFTSSGSIDVNLPVLIFCLAFGLSTDYEVFLVSRIKEEYDRTGDNTESVAVGVEKTGRIITSAALLLIIVVGAFGASKVLPMKEIGVGLAIAIAIDATIVRILLVPATMRLFGDLNWWLPGISSERG